MREAVIRDCSSCSVLLRCGLRSVDGDEGVWALVLLRIVDEAVMDAPVRDRAEVDRMIDVEVVGAGVAVTVGAIVAAPAVRG